MPTKNELFQTSVVSINFKTHEANDINDGIDNNEQLVQKAGLVSQQRRFKT